MMQMILVTMFHIYRQMDISTEMYNKSWNASVLTLQNMGGEGLQARRLKLIGITSEPLGVFQ